MLLLDKFKELLTTSSSIQNRIQLGFIIAIGMALVITYLTLNYIRSVHQHFTTIGEEHHRAQVLIYQLYLAFSEENERIVSYLLSGEKSYLDKYEEAHDCYKDLESQLVQANTFNITTEQLNQITNKHDIFEQEAQKHLNLIDHGFPKTAIFLWGEKVTPLRSQINDHFQVLVKEIDNHIEWHKREAKQEEIKVIYNATFWAIVAIIASTIIAIQISQSLIRPIKKLVDSTQQISKGNLNIELPVSGSNEITALNESMNQMVIGLSESQQKAKAVERDSKQQINQLKWLQNTGREIVKQMNQDSLFETVALKINRSIKCKQVAIMVFDEDCIHIKAITGKPILSQQHLNHWSREFSKDHHKAISSAKIKSIYLTPPNMWLSFFPIEENNKLYGVILTLTLSELADDEKIYTTKSLANQLSTAVNLWEVFSREKQIAATKERERIAHDLHDDVTQSLFSAHLMAKSLGKAWTKSPEKAQEYLHELQQLTQSTLSEMRTLLLELKPKTLLDTDIHHLMHELAKALTQKSGITVALDIQEVYSLPESVHLTFYRVAQEAMNNIYKHSQANSMSLQLAHSNNKIKLVIIDNGKGFDSKNIAASSLGFSIMQDRADAIGGKVTIHSSPDDGTEVHFVWPTKESGASII
ncbi:histidine kinase [Pleionea sp. CnH1-48]|uniref:histidine kinase n=1 Tax=Pleionea sp. CnH1-48 TaxID=2954494 RepID=UPI002097BA31|nr:histidine kinase [Pleionea sp. CnH1-48]MCO7224045.1 histidine kinase [Pleionea sp. CnH1-48]